MKILFEIGLEELPAGLIIKAIDDLENEIKKELKNNRIKYENIIKYSTPRRLALKIEGVASKQDDLDEFKIGPSYDLCYKDGVKTNVLEKFLKSQNVSEKDIEIVENEKGRYISIRKYEKGLSTKEILPEILKNVLYNIQFERNMKWGDSQFRFIRPIKWLLALFDDEIINFEFESIKSSNKTRGMRIVGSQDIIVNSIDLYEKLLEENYVIANREKRKQMIVEDIRKNIDNKDIKTIISEKLLDEVVDLVEYPYPIKANFDKKFLELPEDIITITMETHQRYFSVRDSENKLTNNFVLVRNGYKYSELVKLGNEKVIEPRLSDAKFFYDEDIKKPLLENVEKLKKVIFQKDMGTIYDKIERMHKIADFIIEKLNLVEKEDIHKTIELSKADLVSNVISEKEFTKLQGYMGGIYARKQGYSELISEGIKEHYRPYTFEEKLKTITGKITSISDKLDTLIGCFLVDLIPTSSKDPFALRRACVGIISVLKDLNADISYEELIDFTIKIFEEKINVLNKNAKTQILNLFEDRLINSFIKENKDSKVKEIIINDKNIKSIIEKENKLENLKIENKLDNIIAILRRLNNIAKNIESKEFDKNNLETIDKDIYNLYKNIDNLTFESLLDCIYENYNLIENYFENVKINDNEDRKLLVKKLSDKINNILKFNI